MTLRLSDRV